MNEPEQSPIRKPEEGELLDDKPGAISPERTNQLRQESDESAIKEIKKRAEAGKTSPSEADAMLKELEPRIAPPPENPDGLKK